ncbi:MAG TPA: hypothetical protein VG992_03780 [Candidatus Saccharimonadales bacterium]|nr:hypothetical protein [Candidatus Saccharimonadales bacterium]
MTATNHALTGAVIGLVVGQPLLAVPAAIASHFICDALPHFGHGHDDSHIATHHFRNYLIVEALVCTALVGLLFVAHPVHWFLAATCAFLAAAPDLLWINHFRQVRRGNNWQPNAFSRFASAIQWFQRPIGAVVEMVWFGAAVALLLPFLHG